jgi:hypothetical protein
MATRDDDGQLTHLEPIVVFDRWALGAGRRRSDHRVHGVR